MQRLFLLGVYLFLLPFLIISLTLYSLFFMFSPNLGKVKGITTVYQAVTDESPAVQHEPIMEEARLSKIKNYLTRHNSPLLDKANFIIQKADEYGIDYRLTTAIAMTESTLCRNEHENTHNCWGYGITGGKITWFKTYEDAITEVTRSLSESYGGRGLFTPHEIVTRYNPGSTTWADKVETFMDDIDNSL